MNFLLLLAVLPGITTIYPDPVIPGAYQVWEGSLIMPESSPISRQTRIADTVFQSRPSLQRAPMGDIYEDVETSYPVREVVPRSQRQRVPLEEQMAMDEIQTQQLGRQTAIRGQILNQKLTQKNFEYEDSINRQAEEAIPVLGRLAPGSDDFDTQVAELQREKPLAFQNPGFTQQIGKLVQTHNQLQQNKEILTRGAQEQDAREEYANRRTEEEIMTTLAQYGPEAIAIYQENLKPDESGFITPRRQIEAFAAASGYINRAKAAQIEEKPMTPKERQAYELDLLKERNAIQKRKAEMLTTEGDDIALQYLDRKLREMGVDIPETPSAAPASAIPEGKTATNPQTGEKIIFRSGKWEPIK